jgi:hypothetical protein
MEEGLKVQVSSGKCSEDRRLEDGRQKMKMWLHFHRPITLNK